MNTQKTCGETASDGGEQKVLLFIDDESIEPTYHS